MQKDESSKKTSIDNQLRLSQYLYFRKSKRPPCMKKHFSFAGESVIRLGVDINYQIPENSLATLDSQSLAGCTLLHLAVLERDLNSVKVFLRKGADYTIKDSDGSTPLHRAIEQPTKQYRIIYHLKGKLQPYPIGNVLLSAQVYARNATNLYNKYGISHFHIACILNHEEAVELFLKKGTQVNEAVNLDSPYFPGFTGLHFAARYSCWSVANILMENGADASLEDASGINPLHLIIERNMNVADFLIMEKQETCTALFNEMNFNEYIIKLIIQNYRDNFADTFKLSLLHVYSTFRETTLVEHLLQDREKVDFNILNTSNLRPGYTPLHFATHFSMDTVKLLLENGANILAKDAEGLTPLDLCLDRYSPHQIIYEFLTIPREFQDLWLPDDSINLLDLLMSMILAWNNRNLLEFFFEIFQDLDLALPTDSPLWPGSTLLHLIVVFTRGKQDFNRFYYELDYELDRRKCNKRGVNNLINLELCLKHGASINLKDAHGRTAVHLAYQQNKPEIVKFLLNHNEKPLIENPIDLSTNLSHFHIACSIGDVRAIENFLKNGCDVNLIANENCTTPLHVAISKGKDKIVRLLLENNADPYIVDSRNFTAIHLAFKFIQDLILPFYFLSDDYSLTLLLNRDDLTERVVEDYGLSHLHVATFARDTRAIGKLLSNGADIDVQIQKRYDYPKDLEYLANYAGSTALHIAVKEDHARTVEFLIENNADIYIKDAKGHTPMYYALKSRQLKNVDAFLTRFKNHESYISDLGMTMLHLACWKCDYYLVKEVLESNATVDVNAPVTQEDVWLGYTPLHMLLLEPTEEFERVLDLLLDSGADLMIADSMGRTPLHLSNYLIMEEVDSRGCSARPVIPISLLKTYDTNPQDREGMTHFHLACLQNEDLTIIEEFLKNGCDVNQAIDPLANNIYAGFTPLHLAVYSGSESLVVKLIEAGADVRAEDTKCQVAYQFALNRPFSTDVMRMLFFNGVSEFIQ